MSLSCKLGVSFRHDRIRDTTSNILKEICRDVKIEPELTPIASDYKRQASGNKQDKARSDISCVGLWSPMERTYIDVRIFHPGAPSNKNRSINSLYKQNQNAMKREYNSRIINVEKSTFTPLVLSTHGGVAPEGRALFRRAAKLIAEKRKEKYADVMGYISTKIRMTLMKSILLQVRGSRGTSKGTGKPITSVSFNLVPRNFSDEDF